jgi:hypothetical protein
VYRRRLAEPIGGLLAFGHERGRYSSRTNAIAVLV